MWPVINVGIILGLIIITLKALTRTGQLLRDNEHNRHVIDNLSDDIINLAAENKRLKEALDRYEHYEL